MPLNVELVAVERQIWSGEASLVIARTTEGELGILPGHIPLLGQLAEGATVRIVQEEGNELVVIAHGGFLSVTERGVAILADVAEFVSEIDVARAREALERARNADEDDEDARARGRRAEARLLAVGETV
ncbi:MAG: F0F1 ATP synthase subunit epsilon [Actinomycetota bacterium]|nr:F0F1 ATP synthase subunit epsilon [Actinomycetota bacterium]